jgi:hypothetical protein
MKLNQSQFSYEDLCVIEWTSDRAIRAIRQFADDETKAELESALFILAKVRNLAPYICDPVSEYKVNAVQDFLEIFKQEQV